jgi:hypothetical protein
MKPAQVNLTAAANSYDQGTIAIDGYASAAGVSAAIEFRREQDSGSELLLALSGGAGLTLTSDGTSLTIAWEITETQIDAMAAELATAGRTKAHYSLKVTRADSKTFQYLYGEYAILGVATQ